MLAKIISGGQTGVDRAALNVALDLGIDCGGWCPKGRRAEDGVISARYPLQETASKEYPFRTEKNVRDGDGTLILRRGEADRGTALTIRLAEKHGKPLWVVNLDEETDIAGLRAEMQQHEISILNVAGPRESFAPGIQQEAEMFLRQLFSN